MGRLDRAVGRCPRGLSYPAPSRPPRHIWNRSSPSSSWRWRDRGRLGTRSGNQGAGMWVQERAPTFAPRRAERRSPDPAAPAAQRVSHTVESSNPRQFRSEDISESPHRRRPIRLRRPHPPGHAVLRFPRREGSPGRLRAAAAAVSDAGERCVGAGGGGGVDCEQRISLAGV